MTLQHVWPYRMLSIWPEGQSKSDWNYTSDWRIARQITNNWPIVSNTDDEAEKRRKATTARETKNWRRGTMEDIANGSLFRWFCFFFFFLHKFAELKNSFMSLRSFKIDTRSHERPTGAREWFSSFKFCRAVSFLFFRISICLRHTLLTMWQFKIWLRNLYFGNLMLCEQIIIGMEFLFFTMSLSFQIAHGSLYCNCSNIEAIQLSRSTLPDHPSINPPHSRYEKFDRCDERLFRAKPKIKAFRLFNEECARFKFVFLFHHLTIGQAVPSRWMKAKPCTAPIVIYARWGKLVTRQNNMNISHSNENQWRVKWNRQNRRQKTNIAQTTPSIIVLHRKRNFIFSAFRNNWTLCSFFVWACARVSIMKSIHIVYFWSAFFFFFVRHQSATFSQQCSLSVWCTKMHEPKWERKKIKLKIENKFFVLWLRARLLWNKKDNHVQIRWSMFFIRNVQINTRPQIGKTATENCFTRPKSIIILSINKIIYFSTSAGHGDWLHAAYVYSDSVRLCGWPQSVPFVATNPISLTKMSVHNKSTFQCMSE